MNLEVLRFPIGPFTPPAKPATSGEIRTWVDELAAAPERLRRRVALLGEDRLDTPYRPQGWTVRQVVHHLADSHVNGYVRFRLGLTEDAPGIKTYDEAAWAELPDAAAAGIGTSLDMLDAVHVRWVSLLRSMSPEAYARAVHHPETGPMRLDGCLALYAWHGKHHTAHIERLMEREGWVRGGVSGTLRGGGRRPGNMGAILDEYERAVAELVRVLAGVTRAEYEHLVDPEAEDEDCRSIETVMRHVIGAGFSYNRSVRSVSDMPVGEPPAEPVTPDTVVERLRALLADTERTFEGRMTMTRDEVLAAPIETRWGTRYHIEQMMEHAVMHVLRHRRQVEHFLRRLRGGGA
jgi:uncharacterized damage-inducible protein DinB